jgi:hypothetical protein
MNFQRQLTPGLLPSRRRAALKALNPDHLSLGYRALASSLGTLQVPFRNESVDQRARVYCHS